MTKKIIAVVMILGLVASGTGTAFAATTDAVTATATIGAIQNISVATLKVSDNTATSEAKTIAFGNLSGTVSNAPAYIQVTYASNDSLWKVAVYTNNTTADTSVLKYARAGLLKTDKKDRIPLYWSVYKNPTTPVALTLTENGVPTARTTTAAYGTKLVSDWSVMKDKTDLDDPATAFNDAGTPSHNDDTGVNESWAYAFAGGYCDVMYGSPSYTNLSPVPYYDVAPETAGTYNVDPTKDTLHRVGSTPVVIYVAAGGGFASAGDYSGSIGLDLYHE